MLVDVIKSFCQRDPRRERGEERRRRQTGVGGEERRMGRGRRGEGKQTVEEEEGKQPSVRKRRGRGGKEDFLVGKTSLFYSLCPPLVENEVVHINRGTPS